MGILKHLLTIHQNVFEGVFMLLFPKTPSMAEVLRDCLRARGGGDLRSDSCRGIIIIIITIIITIITIHITKYHSRYHYAIDSRVTCSSSSSYLKGT